MIRAAEQCDWAQTDSFANGGLVVQSNFGSIDQRRKVNKFWQQVPVIHLESGTSQVSALP